MASILKARRKNRQDQRRSQDKDKLQAMANSLDQMIEASNKRHSLKLQTDFAIARSRSLNTQEMQAAAPGEFDDAVVIPRTNTFKDTTPRRENSSTKATPQSIPPPALLRRSASPSDLINPTSALPQRPNRHSANAALQQRKVANTDKPGDWQQIGIRAELPTAAPSKEPGKKIFMPNIFDAASATSKQMPVKTGNLQPPITPTMADLDLGDDEEEDYGRRQKVTSFTDDILPILKMLVSPIPETPKSDTQALSAVDKVKSPPRQFAPVSKLTEPVTFSSKPLELKQFEVVKVLGSGSFGKVLLVIHKQNRDLFAMKVISKRAVVDAGEVAHAHNEKFVLSHLNHPSVVKYCGCFQDHANLYLLTEYVCGGEFFQYAQNLKTIPESFVRFFVASLVDVLDYIHSLGIVFRDLKPENILIDEMGYLKLTDFGFAKMIGNQRTRSFCGTPAYLAPEIILRESGHSFGVDWWSLGILMFELLAGHPPFRAQTPGALYQHIVQGRPKFPAFISKSAKSLIQSLLLPEAQRLGNTGADEVRQHEWFHGFDWKSLRERKTPSPIYLSKASLRAAKAQFGSEEATNEFLNSVQATSPLSKNEESLFVCL